MTPTPNPWRLLLQMAISQIRADGERFERLGRPAASKDCHTTANVIEKKYMRLIKENK